MYAIPAMKDLVTWWATVPAWAKPVVLGFALGLAVTILSALPWFIKQMKALWKWNQSRVDGKVLAPLAEAVREGRLKYPTMNIAPQPFNIAAIAREVKRSEKGVNKSLRRLEAAGKVHEVKKGEWSVGNKTQKEMLDKHWAGHSDEGRFNRDRFNS
jgi:hypothetical protein